MTVEELTALIKQLPLGLQWEVEEVVKQIMAILHDHPDTKTGSMFISLYWSHTNR